MRPTETEYFVLNNPVGAASEIERLRRDFDIEIEVNSVLRRELDEARELLATSHTDGLHWNMWRAWKARRDAFLAAKESE